MSVWKTAKAERVYSALLRIGWTLKKQVGSHRKLLRSGWPNFTFCFHDGEEVDQLLSAKIGVEPVRLNRDSLRFRTCQHLSLHSPPWRIQLIRTAKT